MAEETFTYTIEGQQPLETALMTLQNAIVFVRDQAFVNGKVRAEILTLTGEQYWKLGVEGDP